MGLAIIIEMAWSSIDKSINPTKDEFNKLGMVSYTSLFSGSIDR